MSVKLRDYQREAALFLFSRNVGCVVAPAGAGKTIIGAHAAANAACRVWAQHRRTVKVTWLCNTLEQKEQSIVALQSAECSAPAEITVECYAALPDLSEADVVIVDECFPAGTLVDKTPIEHVQQGSFVSAFDHSVSQVVSRSVVGVRKLEYGGRWVRIELKDGSHFICTEGHPVWTEEYGYIQAIMLRHLMTHGKITLVRNNETAGAGLLSMSNFGDMEESESLLRCRESGQSVLQQRVLENNPFSRKFSEDDTNQYSSQQDFVSSHAFSQPCSYAGSFGENLSQITRPAFFNSTRRKRHSFRTATSLGRGHWSAHGTGYCYARRLGQVSQFAQLLQGRFSRSFGETGDRSRRKFPQHDNRPSARSVERFSVARVGLGRVEIYERGSVERPSWVPKEDTVYNLEVEDCHNYFANGVLVHNCHHVPAEQLSSTLARVKPGAFLYGLTATPHHEDPLRNAVVELTFREFFQIERERVEASGHLIKGQVVMYDLDGPGMYDPQIEAKTAVELAIRMRRYPWLPRFEQERRIKWQLTQEVVQANSCRNAAAVWQANHEAALGESVLVLVHSIEHGQQLAERMTDAVCVHSKLTKKLRREYIEGLRNGSRKILVATSLADEGLDVPRASRLVLAAGGRSAGKLEQRAGRVLRPFEGKNGGKIYDFLDRGATFAHAQAKARLKVYEALGYNPEIKTLAS